MTDHLRNEEGLQRIKKEWMANCVRHVLLRNCFLKHVIERKIEGKGIRGRKRKQLLFILKENRKY